MELSKLMVFLVEANAIAFRVPYFYKSATDRKVGGSVLGFPSLHIKYPWVRY